MSRNLFIAEQTIREFFRESHKAHLERTTAGDYETQINHFERYFAAWLAKHNEESRLPTISDLSVAHIYGAVAEQIGRGRSKDTADKVRRAMLAIWNKATEVTAGAIARPGKIRATKTSEHMPVAWTIDEYNRLLFGATQLTDERVGPFPLSQWLTALLYVTYNSGVRISAIMAVRRTWINITSKRLVIDPGVQKDDEGRSVALLPETLDSLLPLMANGKEGPFDDWKYDRKVEQWPALNLRLKKAIIAGGLAEKMEQITRRDLWHKIRRTFATQIYIATGSIEEVKRRLGHSSIEVSYRYIDFSQVQSASEADLLPRPSPRPLRVVRHLFE